MSDHAVDLDVVVTGSVSTPVDRRPGLRVSETRVLAAEWLKLRTVRSSLVALLGAGVAAVGLGAMFSSLAGSATATGPASMTSDPVQLALGAFTLVPLVVGIVGVLASSSEYATGLIRTTFSTVTDRLRVLRAKAAVIGGSALAVGVVASFLAIAAGRLTYAGSGVLPDLLSGDVMRTAVAMGIYVAGIAVIGVCLGFLLRSTAGGVGILAVGLLVVPALSQLLPGALGEWVSKMLPSSAGAAFANVAVSMTNRSGALLSSGAGLAVFTGWVIGMLLLTALILRRRDA